MTSRRPSILNRSSTQTPQPPRYSVDQHDREVIRNDNLDEDEEHFIGICLQAPQEEHISYDDYYVKYDAPPDTTPIEEIAATGWGDEFSNDEVTPGKVTILEERSDWDDDERSGGKILVIKERLAQNQQEFLDEYLPQWDEHLAIQKQELESEWENPFAAKRGVLPAIKFTHTFISEMCKDAALAKELRDLSLCSAIPIHENTKTIEDEQRSANALSIERKGILQKIAEPDFECSVFLSISEGEGDTHQSISVMVHDTPIEETIFMAIEEDDKSDSEHKEEDN
ncbi:hypothetical protein Tco_1235068 [Tanacetum coccineum]